MKLPHYNSAEFMISMLPRLPKIPCPIPTSDEEYIDLRIKRNKERDKFEVSREIGGGGLIKWYDDALEAYEQEKGTEYCQSIYLQALAY